jgi:hypothetical protein
MANGAFALSGQAAGLRASRLLTAAVGSFSLTGQVAGLRAARLLSAGQGNFTLSGQNVNLIVGGATYTHCSNIGIRIFLGL